MADREKCSRTKRGELQHCALMKMVLDHSPERHRRGLVRAYRFGNNLSKVTTAVVHTSPAHKSDGERVEQLSAFLNYCSCFDITGNRRRTGAQHD